MERRRLGFGAVALGSISLIALEAMSCGGGNEGNTTPVRPTSSPEGSPTATKTIEASPSAIAATQVVEITPTATTTAAPTKVQPSPSAEATATAAKIATPTPEATPRQLTPEEAKPLISTEFAPTDFETVKKSIDSAFGHPDAVNFLLRGPFPEDKAYLYSLLDSSRDDVSERAVACGILIARLYEVYYLTDYGDFYDAALNVYRFALTESPDKRDDLLFVLKTEFGGNPNTDKDDLPLK